MKTVAGSCLIGVKKEARIKQESRKCVCEVFKWLFELKKKEIRCVNIEILTAMSP